MVNKMNVRSNIDFIMRNRKAFVKSFFSDGEDFVFMNVGKFEDDYHLRIRYQDSENYYDTSISAREVNNWVMKHKFVDWVKDGKK